jgi:hypothetical protein
MVLILSPKIEGEGVGSDTSKEVSSTSQSQFVLPDSAIATQTGPDFGPSYAGGMIYDAFTNALYVTGSTYFWSYFDAKVAMERAICLWDRIST